MLWLAPPAARECHEGGRCYRLSNKYLLRCMSPFMAHHVIRGTATFRQLSGAKRTLTNRCSPASIYEYARRCTCVVAARAKRKRLRLVARAGDGWASWKPRCGPMITHLWT